MNGRILLTLTLITFTAIGFARGGLPDQGFDATPKVRTEYQSSNEGTAPNPLTLASTCLFPASSSGCPQTPTVFQQSNFWHQNLSPYCLSAPWSTQCNFWVLILNNEEAYSTLNTGPPDASLPRFFPGQGIFGFTTIYDNFAGNNVPGDNMWRAHLALELFSQFPNPANGGLPYMALGAWEGRGTHQPVGVLNTSQSSYSIVRFGMRLWDFTLPTVDQGIPGTLWSSLVVFADWGTRPKAIQLNLFHAPWDHSSVTPLAILQSDWNWNIEESVYYPGARFVFVDAEDMLGLCGFNVPRLMTVGQEEDYFIDLERLFQCMDQYNKFDEPMPQGTDIPITSVSWMTEGSGIDGWVWTDVHEMRMQWQIFQWRPSEPARATISPSGRMFGSEIMAIFDRINALCEVAPGCMERAEIARSGDPSIYDTPICESLRNAAEIKGITYNYTACQYKERYGNPLSAVVAPQEAP